MTDAQDGPSPRDLALPDVATLDQLVSAVVQEGGHQCWGDMVMLLATTALRISEVSGLRVGDVDLAHRLIKVERQTYPGRGGLLTKRTKGAATGSSRSSMPSGRHSNGSPTLVPRVLAWSPGPVAASSPQRPCVTPRTGMRR